MLQLDLAILQVPAGQGVACHMLWYNMTVGYFEVQYDTSYITYITYYQVLNVKDQRNGRRGSTCQAIHKIPTIVQTNTSNSSEERQYIKKVGIISITTMCYY